jgi:fumarate hydratase subunit beta
MYIKTTDDSRELKCGMAIYLSGELYTARDAAHKKLIELIDKKKKLPFELKGSIIYYVGPCPEKENEVIGSCGPTTSARMDAFTPKLLENGLKAVIGKGPRSFEVLTSLRENKALYLLAVGGAGALYSKCVTKKELLAFPELGCEAIYKLTVKNMPLIVGLDFEGKYVYNS